MKDLYPTIQDWMTKQEPFAIATVIKTWGSSPRPIGSSMIITKSMEMAGSVSGGCVEGSVLKAAKEVLESGMSKELKFGIADEEAWEVGLSCGGKVEVFLEKCPAFNANKKEQVVWQKLSGCFENNKACILVTKLEEAIGYHTLLLPNGEFFGQKMPEEVHEMALKSYRERKHQIVEVESGKYFIQVFPHKSQMLIIGAAHITSILVQLAKLFDFETIVIDPRSVFTNKTTFSIPPDQMHDCYPEEILNKFVLDSYSYAVVLSHDPKIDDPALQILLNSDIAYIGALGSRKTHAKRVARLKEAGFSENAMTRIHAPIGIDINAKRPKEIALSIMGEVVKIQNEFR